MASHLTCEYSSLEAALMVYTATVKSSPIELAYRFHHWSTFSRSGR